MTYLYVPDDDSEYGPVWEESEARQEFTADELSDAVPAELIVMREGSRGHYLAACYLEDAADIIDPANQAPAEEDAQQWRADAAAYNEHGGSYCPEDAAGYDRESRLCSACEYIHDTADAAEGVLSDLGYITTWNDGYTIHRVLEDAQRSEGGEA